ncbi:MAG: acetate--CoA ligase [Candidatus Binatia bacterium]|nr:MAG: acetate--CoA ligase [Candidatus Binatia bacterium]
MARIDSLLREREVFPPPPHIVERSLVPDYETHYARSLEDVEGYWEEVARGFEWFRPWERVLEVDYPNARWFTGARCNIVWNCLDRHLRTERRNKIALLWLGENGEERVFSFARVHREVSRLASALRNLGVRKGDRVVLYMPLVPEGIFAMLACARIGAVHSVVYAGLGAAALRDRIRDAGARTVVFTDVGYRRGRQVPLASIAREALEECPDVEHAVVHRRDEKTELRAGRERDLGELLASASAECPVEEMDSEDWLFLLYTSGSTGRPKGCAYVHGGYMVGATHLWRLLLDVHDEDLYWCMSDIGWIVGHSTMVYGPWCNGTTILVREGTPDFPHPGIVWEIVERYGVSKMFLAPTALRMFLRAGEEWPRKYDLRSLEVVACAGEPLNPEAFRWAHRHILRGRGVLVDNWWQTETAAPVLGTLPSYPAKPGRVGKPFPGYRVEVLDAQGKPVGPHEGGLLCIRGFAPQMFRTVWGDHGRYEESFRRFPGVYVASDVATVDEDGYVAVLGRADDVLNVAGHRIGTAEVESALVSHPAVGEAAVVGKPDPVKGEAIKAFVLLRAGTPPQPVSGGGAARARPQAPRPHRLSGRDRVRPEPPQDALRKDPPARLARPRARHGPGRPHHDRGRLTHLERGAPGRLPGTREAPHRRAASPRTQARGTRAVNGRDSCG